jgi:hypothetical protein
VDIIRASVSDLGFGAGNVQLGPVTPVLCGGDLGAFLWDGIPPEAGKADFFLVREQGATNYGQASTGELRVAGPGDCP